MAPSRDEPKASNWSQPSVPRGTREDPRRRSRAHLRRHLAVVVVLLCAFVLAYFRAPAWTGAPLLSSDASLHSVWHNISGDAQTNVWASDALPAGDWPEDQYLLGVGKADITGPVVELNMMGYADFAQIGSVCDKDYIREPSSSAISTTHPTASFTSFSMSSPAIRQCDTA